jgi:hypothetical protein
VMLVVGVHMERGWKHISCMGVSHMHLLPNPPGSTLEIPLQLCTRICEKKLGIMLVSAMLILIRFALEQSNAEEKMDGWGAGSIYYYEGLGPD